MFFTLLVFKEYYFFIDHLLFTQYQKLNKFDSYVKINTGTIDMNMISIKMAIAVKLLI